MRRFLTPGWLGLHAVAILLCGAFIGFGWWQFDRAQSGNDRSWAYTFEWPLFAIFVIVMWVKMIRDERDGAAPAPKVIEEPAEDAVKQELIKRHEEEDPALAAYNRYLARLNSESRGRR
ncbi:lipoprotein [Mycobacterium tuberculosis]|nr:lipoprotein [Mycobacterium tuberculosis]